MKRTVCLALCAAIMLSLAACGAAGGGEDGPAASEAAQGVSYDWDGAYGRYAPDAVVMTVNGEEVYWEEYFYWLYNEYAQYAAGMALDAAVPGYEEISVGEYVASSAANYCVQYSLVNQMAEEYGVELTGGDLDMLEAQLAGDIEEYVGEGGTAEELYGYLAGLFVTPELYEYVNSTLLLFPRIFITLYGENGEAVTDEEALKFAGHYGFMTVKHILFACKTGDAGELSDAERAEMEQKRELAGDVLAELQAAPESGLEELFDKLMHRYSEDPGLDQYPDGYCFEPGSVVEEFAEASQALEVGGLSGVVESANGFHIILREPVRPDDGVLLGSSEVYTLRGACAVMSFNARFDEYAAGAEVAYAAGFEGFDAASLFE